MMEIAGAGDDHKALRKIAAALLAKAANGDVPAINSLADRTDGKVAQALIGATARRSFRGQPWKGASRCDASCNSRLWWLFWGL